MQVKKIYNNSVVLGVDEDGHEAVLLGAGLGYALSPGMTVDPERIERTFRPEAPAANERLAALLQDIPLADLKLTEAIIAAAQTQLEMTATAHVLIPLADHISFALQRARDGITDIEYPLRWEVQQLYPREVRFAEHALRLITDRTGVALPPVEAIPLALHFVNAHFGSSDISTAMQLTELLVKALTIVEHHLGMAIDPNSLEIARLVTHLRYLYLRQQQGTMVQDNTLQLDAEIRNALPREHQSAQEVAALLGQRWNVTITSEEILYLTLHIGRLSASLRERMENRP